MISYAQNFEDVMLNRVFRNQKNGFYIDAGAMDPVLHSVTKWFYDQGWSGINIEPNPWFYETLLVGRPRDVNLNVALGEREEERLFYVFEQHGISTFDSSSRDRFVEQGFEVQERTVRVTTLDAVCQKYATRQIDFLKVDCEAWEEQVLKGADWDRFRPTVVLVEATAPGTTVPTWLEWEPWLTENARYDMVYFDGLNRFYLRRESAELRFCFAAPPNVFDEFTVIATEAAEQSSRVLQAERDSLAGRVGEFEAQVLNHQNRIAEIEKERSELFNLAKNLQNELVCAQERAADLDQKLREARLWIGRLSQDLAASRR